MAPIPPYPSTMNPAPIILRSEVAHERRFSRRALVCLLLFVALSPAFAQVPATITVQPQNQHECIGGSATFQAAASGTAPFNFSWRSNGVPVFSEISFSNSSFTITNLSQDNNGNNIHVFVFNSYGSAISSNAVLFVPDPGIC